MRNTSVSLGDYYTDFIDSQIRSGRYGSSSEVIRAGLRLLENEELRLKELREALAAGENSGKPHPLSAESFLTKMHTPNEQ